MDIILYYNGHSPHIEHCIRSIRHHSPNSPFHVLGRNLNVEHIDDAPFYDLAYKFSSIYRHESQNSYSLEYNALARWLVIERYLQAKGIKQFANFDCDQLIFCDVDKESKRYEGVDFTWPICSGMFFNPSVLQFMNAAIFDYYNGVENRQTNFVKDWHLRNHHVSDMAFRDMLTQNFKFANTCEGLIQFEGNLHFPEGYEKDEDGYRKLTFADGIPFVKLIDGTPVRLMSIHCWGLYKTRMKEVWDRALASSACTTAF